MFRSHRTTLTTRKVRPLALTKFRLNRAKILNDSVWTKYAVKFFSRSKIHPVSCERSLKRWLFFHLWWSFIKFSCLLHLIKQKHYSIQKRIRDLARRSRSHRALSFSGVWLTQVLRNLFWKQQRNPSHSRDSVYMPKMAREPLVETHSYLLIAQYVSTSYLTQEQTSTRLQDSGLPRFRCFSSPFFTKLI